RERADIDLVAEKLIDGGVGAQSWAIIKGKCTGTTATGVCQRDFLFRSVLPSKRLDAENRQTRNQRLQIVLRSRTTDLPRRPDRRGRPERLRKIKHLRRHHLGPG